MDECRPGSLCVLSESTCRARRATYQLVRKYVQHEQKSEQMTCEYISARAFEGRLNSTGP